ncbi:MAG TPA: phage recombination protein Bet [Pseudomonas sp.]|nr:phage recombination protein Bet [Pseudomonas sp.]
MNAAAKPQNNGSAMVTAEHADAIRTALKTSLYPGASDASVDLVLSYCKAAGLDPMQKPVHIVPMWDAKAGQMRDVVMPGVGLYRTNAARTGEFGGISEPEFGPMVTERIGKVDITFPEWCRVTVSRRLPSGHLAQFTAVEYWIENYAIKGGKEKDQSPNAMWSKRPRGQLAKCAQAQALRMAFPEATGSMPTAEEMEGKPIIEGEATAAPKREPVELPAYSDEAFAENLPKWWTIITTGKKSADDLIAMLQTKARFTPAQLDEIRNPPRDEEDADQEGADS